MIGFADAAEEARQARDAPFAVLSCNWPTAQIWGDLWRRWRKDRVGHREALDLQQMESALALRQVPQTEWPSITEGLLAMEDEAIGIWTEQ